MRNRALLCTLPIAAFVGHFVVGYSWLVTALGSMLGIVAVIKLRL
jgi:hypothetical protein